MDIQSYYYRNRLQILEEAKQKYEEHVLEERIKNCFNYDMNKHKILQKIDCNKCGRTVCKAYLLQHLRTRKCNTPLNTK